MTITINDKTFELTPMQARLFAKVGKADETLIVKRRGVGATFAAMLWAAQCPGGDVLWISSCHEASMEHRHSFAEMFGVSPGRVGTSVVRVQGVTCRFFAATSDMRGLPVDRLVIDGVEKCCNLQQYSGWISTLGHPKVLGIWNADEAPAGGVLTIFPAASGRVVKGSGGRKRLVVEQRAVGNKFLLAADSDYRRRINEASK